MNMSKVTFLCTPGATRQGIEEARLVSIHDDSHETTMAIPGEEVEMLSDFDAQDRQALETSALTQQQKNELLRAALSFGMPQGTMPDASPPPSVPHRGRGRPPKNANTPSATQRTPQTENRIPNDADFEQQPIPTVSVPVVAINPPRETPALITAPPPLPPCPWFDPTGISEEEVKELSVSFPALRVASPVDPSDLNSVAYLQLRNTLIDVYRCHPGTRLTLAECRKHCDGDLAALLRMLSFLERNRLINFALDAGPGPGTDPATRKLKEDLREHWTRSPTCTACDRICLYSFYVLSPAVYGSNLPLTHLKTALWCADCAREAPHNQCLLKVNLPALHTSGGASSWSEQQINALFDAIEAHGPDWISISKAVSVVPGNPLRSPRDCLAAFLSMPLTEQPSTLTSTREATATESPVATADAETEETAMQLLLAALDILSRQKKEAGDSRTSAMMSSLAEGAHSRLEELLAADKSVSDIGS